MSGVESVFYLTHHPFTDMYSHHSLMAQRVKNLPMMQETGVRPLDWKDPLEKGMVFPLQYSCWRIPWTEEPDEVAKSWTRLSEELH